MLKRSSAATVESTKPVFGAIQQGDLAKVKALIAENKKLLNEPNDEGKSPLHVAAALGHTTIVDYLVGEGANVNFMNKFDKRGSFRRLPLHDAAKGGHAAVIQCLAQRQAELNVKDGQGCTALHLAAGFTHPPVEDDVDLKQQHLANEQRFLGVVKALCNQGVDFDLRNQREDSQIIGRTALHLAIVKEHRLIALELIDRGAKIDTKDNDGRSPYFSAYQLGLWDICEALVHRLEVEDQKKPNTDSYFKRLGLDFVDADGRILLHDAAMSGNHELVSLLCKLGANPNAKDKDRKTPVFMAASEGHSKSVELLLAAGANPTIKVRYSEKTALDKARKKGHQDCIKLIETWLVQHPQEDTNLPTESSDEAQEDTVDTIPDQTAEQGESSRTEPVPIDTSSLTSTMALISQFIEENSVLNAELNAQIKTFFEALCPPLSADIEELLSLLLKSPEADPCTLRTQSRKNILHLIAEFDPRGLLLPVVEKLSASQISTLLSQKTAAEKYPYQCASEQAHSKLNDFCWKQMLQSHERTSRFRESLHGDGDFIEWLLGLKHFPKKIPLLFAVMADLYDEISSPQVQRQNTPSDKHRFFSSSPMSIGARNSQDHPASKVIDRRKRLLHRIFHEFDWPDELIEAIARIIGSRPPLNSDQIKEKSKEQQLLDLLISETTLPHQPSPLHNHALVILTLACQSLENNPEKGKFPQRAKLETQYREQFQKRSEEMLKRVSALYDYLCSISPDLGSSFIKKIVKSESLLKFSLQKALSGEGWWTVEIPEQFEETLLLHFKKSGKSAVY